MENKANADIRNAIKAAGIFQWQVASALKMIDSNFTKLLRFELPQERKAEILAAIESVKNN